ncbi:hypothetical protein EDI28_15345 [Photobacterium chitinilyticum]|uniref:Uncharacterized protein n=1 Tax=Photobacterium chitinilyticum TaxID=2485123 RepID=A0A3S3RZU7_9GAMM|nr:hypothetical protein EDI28_15345 [Photobacterium chitinilyticum]
MYRSFLRNVFIFGLTGFLSIKVLTPITEPLSKQSEVLCFLTFFVVPAGFHVLFSKAFELLMWLVIVNNGNNETSR